MRLLIMVQILTDLMLKSLNEVIDYGTNSAFPDVKIFE
jgi:hypothetical protein